MLSLPTDPTGIDDPRASSRYRACFGALDATAYKMFGYADEIQGPMELQCELVSQGVECGDDEALQPLSEETLDDLRKRWTLLLQLDSSRETGMRWGDHGRLFFWIPKEDLDACRTDRAWAILQTT